MLSTRHFFWVSNSFTDFKFMSILIYICIEKFWRGNWVFGTFCKNTMRSTKIKRKLPKLFIGIEKKLSQI